MSVLEELITRRGKLRESEQLVNERIKIERSRLIDDARISRGAVQKPVGPAYGKLQQEVTELRRMIAILLREDTRTFTKLGEAMGVSQTRASQIFRLGVWRMKQLEELNQ